MHLVIVDNLKIEVDPDNLVATHKKSVSILSHTHSHTRRPSITHREGELFCAQNHDVADHRIAADHFDKFVLELTI
jgi:hypothetical protein